MAYVKTLKIWGGRGGDITGADFWFEQNGGRRVFWVPGGVNNPFCLSPTGIFAAGAMYPTTGSPDALNEAAHDHSAGDDTEGGPDIRPDHIFVIRCRGYDRLWIQWRGELISLTGITSTLAVNTARSFFGTRVFAWAYGIPVVEPYGDSVLLLPSQLPTVVLRNSGLYLQAASGFGNYKSGGAQSGDAAFIASGDRLWVTSPGITNPLNSGVDPRRVHGSITHTPLFAQLDAERALLAVHMWGWDEFSLGTNWSHFPVPGDKYGFTLRVGHCTDVYSQDNAVHPGGVRSQSQLPLTAGGKVATDGVAAVASTPDTEVAGVGNWYGAPVPGELTVSGLDCVLFALCDNASGWSANTAYAGTTHAIIKGSLYARLEADTPTPDFVTRF